jgi:hypothetical protein
MGIPTHRKINYEFVIAQSSKVVKLHREYGVTIQNLAKRFACGAMTIKRILKAAR